MFHRTMKHGIMAVQVRTKKCFSASKEESWTRALIFINAIFRCIRRVISIGRERARSQRIERIQYAQEFVAPCRVKSLDAVAITDHHDLCIFKYIRQAAEQETDENGNALPPERRLTVFPGVELTLAVPCQALLILDADFSIDLLPQVVQALSIAPAPDDDATPPYSAP
jgi:hypothetical protein